MLVRTVILTVVMSSTPSNASALMRGVVMTRGLTLTCTASKTSLPARSMAEERWKVSSMRALSAAMSALTTFSTFPPAR